jgi:cytochrome P450
MIDNLPKALEAYIKLKPVIGTDSMITLEGEHWQKLRKMFNPAFSQGHLEKLVPGIVDETLIFVDILTEAAKSKNKEVLMLDAMTVTPPSCIG